MRRIRETRLVVEGGHKIVGEIELSGSKNSALSMLSASLLASGESIVKNVPLNSDVIAMIHTLKKLNAKIEVCDGNVLKINTNGVGASYDVPVEITRKTRASILIMGALLPRIGKIRIGVPGGDRIGQRPLDLHLKGLKALGAKIRVGENYIEAEAKKLRGNYIFLDYPSSTATELLMMAASLAEGTTIIDNAETKPEITDLADYLKKMGAKISGAGTTTIKIKGIKKLSTTNHSIIPDYLEACTFMIASAITRGELCIHNVVPDHLRPAIAKLKESGVQISQSDSSLQVKAKDRIKATNIVATKPYPGLSSDMQPLFVSLLTKAKGISIVKDLVFENRFRYVSELRKMGAEISTFNFGIIVRGVKKLIGTTVTATDIRGGAALLLAGLTAEGETNIIDAYHIDRGYDKIEEKLNKIGAKITRKMKV